MTISYLIYPSGNVLYGKASVTADPWASDAVTLTDLGDNLYSGNTATPLIYLQDGGAPASTDEKLGELLDLHYGTVAQGDIFHARRLHSWDWNNSTTVEKVRALYNATMLIDKFNFIGTKVSSGQNLEFPRECVDEDGEVTTIHDGEIPKPIEEAAYLIADALLSGRDPQADFEGLMTKVETFGPVRTEYERARGPQEHLANLIPSPDAWQRIKPFVEIATSFDYKRG